MAHDQVFVGEIYKGRFIPDDPTRYARTIERLEGKRVQFVVGTEPKRRSDNQRAFYWAAIVRAAVVELYGDEYDRDAENDIHETLLHRVLLRMFPERWLRQTKRKKFKLESRPSTSELTGQEMSDYIDRCKDFLLHEWGIHVPEREWVSLKKRR